MAPPRSLVFAIPDHPWVESAEGAAVRFAMAERRRELRELDEVERVALALRERLAG